MHCTSKWAQPVLISLLMLCFLISDSGLSGSSLFGSSKYLDTIDLEATEKPSSHRRGLMKYKSDCDQHHPALLVVGVKNVKYLQRNIHLVVRIRLMDLISPNDPITGQDCSVWYCHHDDLVLHHQYQGNGMVLLFNVAVVTNLLQCNLLSR